MDVNLKNIEELVNKEIKICNLVLQHELRHILHEAVDSFVASNNISKWRESWLCEEYVSANGSTRWLWQVTVNSYE